MEFVLASAATNNCAVIAISTMVDIKAKLTSARVQVTRYGLANKNSVLVYLRADAGTPESNKKVLARPIYLWPDANGPQGLLPPAAVDRLTKALKATPATQVRNHPSHRVPGSALLTHDCFLRQQRPSGAPSIPTEWKEQPLRCLLQPSASQQLTRVLRWKTGKTSLGNNGPTPLAQPQAAPSSYTYTLCLTMRNGTKTSQLYLTAEEGVPSCPPKTAEYTCCSQVQVPPTARLLPFVRPSQGPSIIKTAHTLTVSCINDRALALSMHCAGTNNKCVTLDIQKPALTQRTFKAVCEEEVYVYITRTLRLSMSRDRIVQVSKGSAAGHPRL